MTKWGKRQWGTDENNQRGRERSQAENKGAGIDVSKEQGESWHQRCNPLLDTAININRCPNRAQHNPQNTCCRCL